MGSLSSQAAALLFLCAVIAPALAQVQAPQRMYKCVDAQGRTYYTQVPPPECLGRDTQELNKSGTLIRRNAAPLTSAQEQAREAERKKKLEDEEKSKEERRKNMALLNTYSSEKDIDDARARALEEAKVAIVDTERVIASAQKRRTELDAEKEFYVKKPMPFKLRQEVANNELEIKTQTELLDAKKKEISTINTKYDEDKRRYVELTGSGKAGTTAQKK
ncbi:MAG TPA: DUF4124 domain-containing protein [Burkholderiales bacterium]|nr:DUF4124 domain-containing protein [Burkholderiales bacterium]